MSNEVENRVVSVTFDNSKFASKMKETLDALKKFRESLKLTEGAKGFRDVASDIKKIDTSKTVSMMERLRGAIDRIRGSHSSLDLDSATKFDGNTIVNKLNRVKEAIGGIGGSKTVLDLTPLSDSTDQVSAKFVAMASVIGGVLGGLASQAAGYIGRFTSVFTGPLTEGFSEFETNMGSIQTILANTDRYGTTLDQVTASLDDLNTYSDKTIYNFGDMVRNIGLFTNAGLELKASTSMIKGFSNAAAASGVTAQGAAGAAYQLSQALSNGTVRLMDWKSLTNVGMGSANMKQGIIEIAESMGTLDKAGVKSKEATEHFNETLEKGWLSADVMSNYLQIMAGDMSAAEMSALGLSDAQIEWFTRQQKIAEDSATKVRTFTQLIGTTKEAIGSGWSESFRHVVGGFDEGTTLFTDMSKAIGTIVDNSANARNTLLEGWAVFGGRNALIDGLRNSWEALLSVLGPIRIAFRSMFPRQTIKSLVELTVKFRDFTKGLKLGSGTTMKVFRIFRGFFGIIKMGVAIVKGVARVFGAMFKAISGGGDRVGVLSFLANIMDFFAFLGSGAASGGPIEKFFDILVGAVNKFSGVVQPVFKFVSNIFGEVAGFIWSYLVKAFLFLGDNVGKIASAFKTFWGLLGTGLEYIRGKLMAFWDVLARVFGPAANAVKTGASAISNAVKSAFGGLMDGTTTIKDAAMSIGKTILDALGNLGTSLSGVVTMVRDKAVAIGSAIFNGVKNSIVGNDWFAMIKQVGVDLYEGFMRSIDAHSPSKVFTDAAMAIPMGIAAGIKAGWNFIKDVFGGIVDGLKALFGGLGDAISSENGERVVKASIAGAILKMGLDLTSIFRGIGKMFKDLGRIFRSIDGVIEEFGDTLKAFQLKLKAEALKSIAIAVAILAASMIALSFIDAGKLYAGTGAMALGLTAITTAMILLDKYTDGGRKMVQTAFGVGLIAAALFILAFAIAKLGSIDSKVLAQGIYLTVGALVALTLAVRLMGDQNENVSKAGLAILLMSGAMWVMALAIEKMGNIPWDVMINGLKGVAGSLVILILAMWAMSKIELEKAGLGMLVMAWGLQGLAKAVKTFANIDPKRINQGLGALAASLLFVVVAAMGIPKDMPARAAGLAIMAVGLLIIAGVVKIFGSMDFESLAKGIGAMTVALLAIALAAMLMSSGLGGAAALLLMSIAISGLVDSIQALASMKWQEIALGIGAIVVAMLAIGVTAAILGIISPLIFLFGIALTTVGLGMVLFGAGAFLLARSMQILLQVGTDGVKLFIDAVREVLKALPEFLKMIGQAVLGAITDFLEGFKPIIDALGSVLKQILDKVIELLPDVFELFSKLIAGLLKIITDSAPDLVEAGMTLITELLKGLSDNASKMAEMAVTILINFIEGLTDAIEEKSEEIGEKARGIAKAILDGIISMLLPDSVKEKISELVNGMIDWFKSLLGINSPSTVFAGFGGDIIQGLLNGLTTMLGAIWEFFVGLPGQIFEWLGDLLGLLFGKGGDLLTGLLNGIVDGFVAVALWFGNLGSAVVEKIGDLTGSIKTKGSDLLNGLWSGISEAWDAIYDWFAGLGDTIFGAVGDVWETLKGIGSDIVNGLKEGIANNWDLFVDWFRDKVGGIPVIGALALKIFSPSREFMYIGDMVVAGLRKGMSDSFPAAYEDVRENSESLIDAMNSGLSEIDGVDPTITPVIDLTEVKMGVAAIDDMLSGQSVTPDTSLNQARLISTEANSRRNGSAQEAKPAGDVTYVQNNYSPKALSTADIYRNTKGQIARAKEELGIAS